MSRDEQVEARARELVMAAYAEAGMQPQPWFLHDDPASFRGSDYFLFKAITKALRGASGGGVDAVAMERLRIMSKQKLASEMEDHEIDCADWQGGYEHMVSDARAVFASIAPDHPAENAKSSGDRTGAEIAQVGCVERRERIARIINPICFKSWQALHDYCVNAGDGEDAIRFADKTHGPDIAEALAKADEIIAALARSGKGEG